MEVMTAEVEPIEKFRQELAERSLVEEKVRYSLDFMREVLSEGKGPRFRLFWEVRTLCIPLFKEGVHPAIRAQLWQEFSDLSKEARALKEHLDKQSAFALEQIELTVTALEGEVETLAERSGLLDGLTLPLPSKVFEGRLAHYDTLQRQLTVLNGAAQRINSMRRELTETSMRVRDRTRLFKRLSAVGDKVFPQRRDLIKQVSDDFVEDIDRFVADSFVEGIPQGPLYVLRDEIKGLQAFAKQLTLNTHAFSASRERLSECWDRVRTADKERKKGMAEKRVASREVTAAFEQKVEALAGRVSEMETDAASREMDGLSQELKDFDIPPGERRRLREKLGAARKVLFERVKEAESKRREEMQARIAGLEAEVAGLEISRESLDALRAKVKDASIPKGEKGRLLAKFQPLEDRLVVVEEEALLEGDGVEQLAAVLRERKGRRAKIKEEVERLRKEAGGSGFDIEAAMRVDAQLQAERGRLEAIEASIAELQKKIRAS